MAKILETAVQKRFSDIDPFQHVNNVSQQMYFDVGKSDFFDRLLGPGAVERILAGVKGMDGFDLGLAGIGELTAQIARLAGAAYAESIRAKYDD